MGEVAHGGHGEDGPVVTHQVEFGDVPLFYVTGHSPVALPRTTRQVKNPLHLNLLLGQVRELLAEQATIARTEAGALVDLEEDARVPVEGHQQVVDQLAHPEQVGVVGVALRPGTRPGCCVFITAQ